MWSTVPILLADDAIECNPAIVQMSSNIPYGYNALIAVESVWKENAKHYNVSQHHASERRGGVSSVVALPAPTTPLISDCSQWSP